MGFLRNVFGAAKDAVCNTAAAISNDVDDLNDKIGSPPPYKASEQPESAVGPANPPPTGTPPAHVAANDTTSPASKRKKKASAGPVAAGKTSSPSSNRAKATAPAPLAAEITSPLSADTELAWIGPAIVALSLATLSAYCYVLRTIWAVLTSPFRFSWWLFRSTTTAAYSFGLTINLCLLEFVKKGREARRQRSLHQQIDAIVQEHARVAREKEAAIADLQARLDGQATSHSSAIAAMAANHSLEMEAMAKKNAEALEKAAKAAEIERQKLEDELRSAKRRESPPPIPLADQLKARKEADGRVAQRAIIKETAKIEALEQEKIDALEREEQLQTTNADLQKQIDRLKEQQQIRRRRDDDAQAANDLRKQLREATNARNIQTQAVEHLRKQLSDAKNASDDDAKKITELQAAAAAVESLRESQANHDKQAAEQLAEALAHDEALKSRIDTQQKEIAAKEQKEAALKANTDEFIKRMFAAQEESKEQAKANEGAVQRIQELENHIAKLEADAKDGGATDAQVDSRVEEIRLHLLGQFDTEVERKFQHHKAKLHEDAYKEYHETVDGEYVRQQKDFDAKKATLEEELSAEKATLQEGHDAEKARINKENEAEKAKLKEEADAEKAKFKQDLDAEKASVQQRIDAEKASLQQQVESEKANVQQRIDTETASLQQQVESEKANVQQRIDAEKASFLQEFESEKANMLQQYEAEKAKLYQQLEAQKQAAQNNIEQKVASHIQEQTQELQNRLAESEGSAAVKAEEIQNLKNEIKQIDDGNRVAISRVEEDMREEQKHTSRAMHAKIQDEENKRRDADTTVECQKDEIAELKSLYEEAKAAKGIAEELTRKSEEARANQGRLLRERAEQLREAKKECNASEIAAVYNDLDRATGVLHEISLDGCSEAGEKMLGKLLNANSTIADVKGKVTSTDGEPDWDELEETVNDAIVSEEDLEALIEEGQHHTIIAQVKGANTHLRKLLHIIRSNQASRKTQIQHVINMPRGDEDDDGDEGSSGSGAGSGGNGKDGDEASFKKRKANQSPFSTSNTEASGNTGASGSGQTGHAASPVQTSTPETSPTWPGISSSPAYTPVGPTLGGWSYMPSHYTATTAAHTRVGPNMNGPSAPPPGAPSFPATVPSPPSFPPGLNNSSPSPVAPLAPGSGPSPKFDPWKLWGHHSYRDNNNTIAALSKANADMDAINDFTTRLNISDQEKLDQALVYESEPVNNADTKMNSVEGKKPESSFMHQDNSGNDADTDTEMSVAEGKKPEVSIRQENTSTDDADTEMSGSEASEPEPSREPVPEADGTKSGRVFNPVPHVTGASFDMDLPMPEQVPVPETQLPAGERIFTVPAAASQGSKTQDNNIDPQLLGLDMGTDAENGDNASPEASTSKTLLEEAIETGNCRVPDDWLGEEEGEGTNVYQADGNNYPNLEDQNLESGSGSMPYYPPTSQPPADETDICFNDWMMQLSIATRDLDEDNRPKGQAGPPEHNMDEIARIMTDWKNAQASPSVLPTTTPAPSVPPYRGEVTDEELLGETGGEDATPGHRLVYNYNDGPTEAAKAPAPLIQTIQRKDAKGARTFKRSKRGMAAASPLRTDRPRFGR